MAHSVRLWLEAQRYWVRVPAGSDVYHRSCAYTVLLTVRRPGSVFSYKLRYIVGFLLVEIAISTNQKPTIYRNLYENTDPGVCNTVYDTMHYKESLKSRDTI